MKVSAWAILDSTGKLIFVLENCQGEECAEIYRTKELADGCAFSDEKVVPITISWSKSRA
jgi:hypothetical protein